MRRHSHDMKNIVVKAVRMFRDWTPHVENCMGQRSVTCAENMHGSGRLGVTFLFVRTLTFLVSQ